ncbi:hypothetical protein ES702_00703 [subsurface metagenome]
MKIGRKTKKFIQYYGKDYVNKHYKKGQTKLDEEIEHNNFRIGDKVKFKRPSPDYIMIIRRFIDVDYVSLCLPDGDKMFSAFSYLDSLEKVDEN